MVVYAIADISNVGGKSWEIVTPPPGANPNLAAQSGCLTRFEWDAEPLWEAQFDQPTVEWPEQRPTISAFVVTRSIRVELPADCARDLLTTLQRRGVDSVSLFPGLHGLVKVALDSAWTVRPKS